MIRMSDFTGFRVPDPPEYEGPEFDGCPFDCDEVDESDECLCCEWHEVCKNCFREGETI